MYEHRLVYSMKKSVEFAARWVKENSSLIGTVDDPFIDDSADSWLSYACCFQTREKIGAGALRLLLEATRPESHEVNQVSPVEIQDDIDYVDTQW